MLSGLAETSASVNSRHHPGLRRVAGHDAPTAWNLSKEAKLS
jgi:hypothetical protein